MYLDIFEKLKNFNIRHKTVPAHQGNAMMDLFIYFCARDNQGRTIPTFVDLEMNNLCNVTKINTKPLLSFGREGTFDENGIMPTCVVKDENKVLMHYTGWSPRVKSSYGLAIGLAISSDNGLTFEKYSDGAIIDRSINDPIFPAGSVVMKDNDVWKMWYISCTEWKIVNGKTEPVYLIKYADSDDGINWKTSKNICINYKYDGEALGRPWVIKENNIYKMWYATRGSLDYRKKDGQHYKIGYAESNDGINWIRLDEIAGITTSETGWDSEMITYCSIYEFNNNKYMFYNGNGFGKSGFGYALLDYQG